jgi:hypothetical protein
MLLTEQDAVMKKWCLMIRLRWEARAICVSSLQSGPLCPLWKHAVSNIFPTPASPDEGEFLRMPGVGLHDVAIGDQRFAPIRAGQGIAPGGAAQGYCGLAGAPFAFTEQ